MEEKKIKLELTNQELDVVYRSLLEMPAKFSLPVIRAIEVQVKGQELSEDVKKTENVSTDKENV
jgi:hypothetical protein